MAEWGSYVTKPYKNQVSTSEPVNDPYAVYELQFNYTTIIPDSLMEPVIQAIAGAVSTMTGIQVLYIRAENSYALIQFRPYLSGLGIQTLNPFLIIAAIIAVIVAAIAAVIIFAPASVAAYKLVDQAGTTVSYSILLVAAGMAAIGFAILSSEVRGAGYVKRAKTTYRRAKKAYQAAGG